MVRNADDYESEYMSDGGDVVHREKMSFPSWFRWLIVLAMTLAIGLGAWGSLMAGSLMPAIMYAIMLPMMLFFFLLMSTLRVTVTNQQLTVQYGPWGPRIPLERIEKCDADDYKLWRYGGYGIRYSIIENAWCYNMVGDQGKAVRIHYRTESGKLKKVLVASRDNHRLADAINHARASQGQRQADVDFDDEVLFAESPVEAEEPSDVEAKA